MHYDTQYKHNAIINTQKLTPDKVMSLVVHCFDCCKQCDPEWYYNKDFKERIDEVIATQVAPTPINNYGYVSSSSSIDRVPTPINNPCHGSSGANFDVHEDTCCSGTDITFTSAGCNTPNSNPKIEAHNTCGSELNFFTSLVFDDYDWNLEDPVFADTDLNTVNEK